MSMMLENLESSLPVAYLAAGSRDQNIQNVLLLLGLKRYISLLLLPISPPNTGSDRFKKATQVGIDFEEAGLQTLPMVSFPS
jgi:hypothetical protein